MRCPHAFDDGAYLIGALSPAERQAFERHLAGCEQCTRSVGELAGLPGLLARVDPEVLTSEPSGEPLPESLLPALTGEVRRSRRRGPRVAVVAVAAAAAAAVAVVALLLAGVVTDTPAPSAGPGTSTTVTREMRPVGDVPVSARLTLEEVAWGTRVGLTCTYETDSVDYELPPEVDYWLVVRTSDGSTEPVGSWRSVDGETLTFTAGTATERDEITSVEVRAPGGRVVLRSHV